MTSDTFLAAYEKTARLNGHRLQGLDLILTEFQSLGIEVLPLRGADLLGRAYGGVLGLRPMWDVDLLCHREDHPRLERILLANRFQPVLEGCLSYMSPDRRLVLEMMSDI